MYWNYFKYIVEHKKNVFIECMKRGLFIKAFTHDLSKFLPSEFVPYAKYFGTRDEVKKLDYVFDFEKAWTLHYSRNKHHPEHWEGMDMPERAVAEMVCDLKAMSRKFGGSAQEYYFKNYFKWNLSTRTRYNIEKELDLLISVLPYEFQVVNKRPLNILSMYKIAKDLDDNRIAKHGHVAKFFVDFCFEKQNIKLNMNIPEMIEQFILPQL